MKYTKLQVLSDINLLHKALTKRGIKVKVNGKVWSDELETYISAAEAFLAGLGKARKTKDESYTYNLLLEKAAMDSARKWQKSVRSRHLDWDKAKVLDIVVNTQERMAKGMQLIEKANRAISAIWQTNQFAGYVWKAWNTEASARTEKQKNCLNHHSNKALIAWFDYRAKLWAKWNELKADSCKLADEFNLWPDFHKLVRTSYATHTYEERPMVRDEGLDWNEPPSGLTGEWPVDPMGCMADSHVEENATLNAAHKAAEYGKRMKRYCSNKREIKATIAWVKARKHQEAIKALGFETEAKGFEESSSFFVVENEDYTTQLVQSVELFLNS